MADDPLAELLQELDLAVIEWLPDQTFRAFAPPPRWFRGMAQWSSLPFLEHFLPDAEAHWRTAAAGVLDSHPFAVDSQGEELLLRARALKIDGRQVMAIERLVGDADLRPVLRKARDQALDHERLTEQARAVQAPASAVEACVAQLQNASLTPEQAAIVEPLARASASLRKAVGELPQPRKRRK